MKPKLNQADLDELYQYAARITGKGRYDQSWRKADLTPLLHSGQRKIQETFLSSPHQLQVVLCARGFGKTYWGATTALSQMLQTPRSRVKIATEFQTDLESLILPNFEQVLDTCPEDLQPRWRPSKSRFLSHNGSSIDLIGLDRKPNGLRGQHNVDLILLEEAGFISKLEKIYRSVLVPITTHRPNCKIVLISTPPESTDHYFWELADRAKFSGALSIFTIDDNPMLTAKDVQRIEEEMGGRQSIQFRREYLCERIMDTTRAIIPEWERVGPRTVLKELASPPAFYKPMVAIDLGLNDDCGVVFGYYNFDSAKVVIQAELLLNGVNSKELIERCLEIEKRLWGDLVPMRWADGALYTINDICSIHHYSVSPVRKDVLEAQVNQLRLLLNAGQVEIAASCQRTIHQCATGTWDKNKQKFERKGSSHQDLLAALIYFCRHLNKENPYPPNYNFDRDNMHWRPNRMVPSHLQTIKKAFGPKG